MRPTEPTRPAPETGFSLVELLVSMVFISILVAGCAQVFKATLGNFVASAETVSSARQNNLSLQLLADDLNDTGMTPTSLNLQPTLATAANPPFQIIPNVAYAGTDSPTPVTDQLYLYYDRFLPYSMSMATALLNTAQDLQQNIAYGTGNSFTIKFSSGNPVLAAQEAATEVTNAIANGQTVMAIQQSNGESSQVQSLSPAGVCVLVPPYSSNIGAPIGSLVNLVIQGEYFQYAIQPVLLDPSQPTVLTPCLVRNLVVYPNNGTTTLGAAAWAAPISQVIIADNVTAFHVGISADAGNTWAGISAATGTWSTSNAAWSDLTGPAAGAASPTINYQLANLNGAAAGESVASGVWWFREYPLLVRVDITTRTLNKRTEYATATTANYKYFTRTLILNPRHFGLRF